MSWVVEGLQSWQVVRSGGPLLHSMTIPWQGTQMDPSAVRTVSISFSVQASSSSQGWVVVSLSSQFAGVPMHGTQIAPSQSSTVWTSLMVEGLPSSQGVTEGVPSGC